jgi:Family of unknown function (DUF6055)
MNLIFILSLLINTVSGNLNSELHKAELSGEISTSQRLSILEKSIIDPSTIPEKWRKFIDQKVIESGTPLLVSIYQQRHKLGILPISKTTYKDSTLYFDSEIYPIRVYYFQANLEDNARTLLEESEFAWQVEVEEFGFIAPQTRDSTRYSIYLQDCGGALGYNAPYGAISSTDWDDCYSHICVSDPTSPSMMGMVIYHELNHAMQAATDCLEPLPFWENSAVFMESAVPSLQGIGRPNIGSFQDNPHWSLASGANEYYEFKSLYIYHGYIWPLFLAATYGDGPNDGTFVRKIWEGSRQNSGTNSPDYLQATDVLLRELGSTLDQAFFKFSSARYFVGENSDSINATMPYAQNLSPAPKIMNSFSLGYENEFSPALSLSPKPYGVNYYILYNDEDSSYDVTISLNSESSDIWALGIVSMENGETLYSKSDTSDANITIDTGLSGDYLLIVMNLGKETFKASEVPISGSQYELKITPTIPIPSITYITPSEFTQGETKTITIYGDNFNEDTILSFTPSDQIEIISFNALDKTQAKVEISVKPTALLGGYIVNISAEGTGTTSVENGITISAAPQIDSQPASGCSNSPKRSKIPLTMLIIFTLVLFITRKTINRGNL